jgi:hypothetical protein
VVALVIVLLVRRSRARAQAAWREQSAAAVDMAHLAFNLLPASAQDIPDAAHWASVRRSVEEAADGLDRAAASAPTDAGAQSTRRGAEALRGVVFAVESERLLRAASPPPTAEQLFESDAVARSRRSDAAVALRALDRLVGRGQADAPRSAPGPA